MFTAVTGVGAGFLQEKFRLGLLVGLTGCLDLQKHHGWFGAATIASHHRAGNASQEIFCRHGCTQGGARRKGGEGGEEGRGHRQGPQGVGILLGLLCARGLDAVPKRAYWRSLGVVGLRVGLGFDGHFYGD